MLLLMRRAGEAVRIKEDIIVEVSQILDDKVTFMIQGTETTTKEASSISEEL